MKYNSVKVEKVKNSETVYSRSIKLQTNDVLVLIKTDDHPKSSGSPRDKPDYP